MRTTKIVCPDCLGKGYRNKLVEIPSQKQNKKSLFCETCYVMPQQEICQNCDGKGHFEYVVFSPEEAKAILEHCGISTKEEA